MKLDVKYEYKKLNTKYLVVDPLSQRELKSEWVNKIVKNFNPMLVNPIKVSFRDGKYYIIDGHHTMAAIKKKNRGEDCLVECKVFYGLTWLDECELFLLQTGDSHAVNINDKLRVKMNSGDPDVTKMCRAAEKAGFTIDFKGSKGPNKIVALSTLIHVYNNMNEQEFFDYLCLLKRTWGGVPESLSREILQGVFLFCKAYDGKFKANNFVNRLKKVSPTAIIRDGRVSSAPGATKYARQILGHYNFHAKDRLPDLL